MNNDIFFSEKLCEISWESTFPLYSPRSKTMGIMKVMQVLLFYEIL